MLLPIHAIARASAMLAATALIAACSKGEAEAGGGGDEHGAHVHSAKFGGEVIPAGDHIANIEVVHSVETGELTVYTLDGHNEELVKSPEASLTVAISGHDFETFDLTLAADVNELTKNKVGSTSMYVGQSDTIKGVDHFHGTVGSVTLSGTVFEGLKFDIGGSHDDHDEGHEEHDGHDDKGNG